MSYVAVIHPVSLGVTEYTMPWIGVGESDGVVYGLSATALQSLSGSIESGTEPSIQTGQLALSDGFVCNVPLVHAAIRSTDAITVSTTIDKDGEHVTYSYTVAGMPGAQTRMRRFHLGRGAQSRSWTFAFHAAGAWALDQLDIVVKRVKRVF